MKGSLNFVVSLAPASFPRSIVISFVREFSHDPFHLLVPTRGVSDAGCSHSLSLQGLYEG